MLPSAVVDSAVIRKLLEDPSLKLEEVPHYICDSYLHYKNVLRLKEKFIRSPIDFEVFLKIDSEENEIKWAVINFNDTYFKKISSEDFKFSTEEIFVMLPYERLEPILFNIDKFSNKKLFEDEWRHFNGLWK